MSKKINNITINTIKELKDGLTKSQLAYLRDKAKNAMEAYGQLMLVRECCDDPSLAEKIYGTYIFVVYRSIFNKNFIDSDTSLRINYAMFLNQDADNKFFAVENVDECDKFHNLIFGLVNQVYAHTDFGSEYKDIKIDKEKIKGITNPVKMERKTESGINFDGITKAVNILATVFYNVENCIKEDSNSIYFAKYDNGSWLSVCGEDD